MTEYRAWKPLKCPVRDWPLAICDASSLSKDDLVSSDVLYPKYVTENMYLHFDESQKWYWLPDQSEDELLLFKAMDSGSSCSWREQLNLSCYKFAKYTDSMSSWRLPTAIASAR